MPASYHLDPFKYSLQKMKADLQDRQLIPSRKALQEGLVEKFKILEEEGIHNLGDLISALKNKRKLAALSSRTGLEETYLNLLRREANSYLPNPVRLDRFSGVSDQTVQRLHAVGIKHSRHLYQQLGDDRAVEDLARTAGINKETLLELLSLSDLTRAYGVGPAFARLLYDAGIRSIRDLRNYSPAEVVALYEDQTGKNADFSTADIQFSLEVIRALDIAGDE